MPHGIFPESLARIHVEDKACGQQYMPSNGTEGHIFIESWCGECARDRSVREGEPLDECDDNEVCQIIGASFRGEANEWQIGPDGQPHCTAYVPAGHVPPSPRCEHTQELPF